MPASVVTTDRKVIGFESELEALQKSIDQQFDVQQFEAIVGRKAKFRVKVGLKVLRGSAQRKWRKLQRKLAKLASTDCDLLLLADGAAR